MLLFFFGHANDKIHFHDNFFMILQYFFYQILTYDSVRFYWKKNLYQLSVILVPVYTGFFENNAFLKTLLVKNMFTFMSNNTYPR